MSNITDIKRRILELAPAPFQEFCDTLISKQGYGIVHGLGMQSGTGNTTKGNPDTYFRKENGKYVFVVYTIQQTGIFPKIKEDIDKCLDFSKTGLHPEDIEEIICCHTSSNLSAGDDKELHNYCESKGILLTIWGIDELANQVYNRYRSLAKDCLGLNISTNQILSVDEFVLQYNANAMAAPLNTIFQYREKEKIEIINALEKNPIVVVTGKAGVGKTRLVLETVKEVSSKKGYKLLCIKNNNLGIYDDLVSATEQPDKYLFFIDDANELADLKQILEYITKGYLGYEVKIITTVRDYAKEKVLQEVKEYCFSKIIEITSFTDDEIKGFLHDNMNIHNEKYIKQIIRISEGNPRIAYMAGRLAIESQNLVVIKDATQLYDAYYKKYVNAVMGQDNDLCFVAGVLSITNAIMFDKMTVLKDLLDNYGISIHSFKEKVLYLSKMEVVEIHLDQVATLSDQCLANYMLYYVFFDKKLISLSSVLEVGYKHFRKGAIRTINTLLNLFESDETSTYCKQEILKVWDNLKKCGDSCYDDFVRDFHIFRPEEAFVLAQQKIDKIDLEDFDFLTVDFSKNVFCQEESVLQYLTGYQYSEYLECVMELLLNYCSKTPDTLVSGYKWLKNYYGVDIYSYQYGYYNLKKVSEYLYHKVLEGNSIARIIGFQWSKYSLDFRFQATEMGRNNQFIFYNIESKYSKQIMEYRSICWEILIALSSEQFWNDNLLSFLNSYAINLRGEVDDDIVSSEVKFVEELLSALDCNRISYLNIIQNFILNYERMKIKHSEKWQKLLKGKEWILYQLLKDDFASSGLEYKEYQETRNEMISNYGKSITVADITDLVQTMNKILSDTLAKRESYCIIRGIELIVQQFNVDVLHEFMQAFFKYGSNIPIRPNVVIEILNKEIDSILLLTSIKEADFPQKNMWLFSFFDTLPEKEVSPNMLREFMIFLNSDSDKSIKMSSCRNLRVLDKFLNIEPNIYPISCSIIFEKRYYSPFIVEIYFELLFCDSTYTPKQLLSLFQSDINILQEIYFYMLKKGRLMDIKGTFSVEFFSLGESWIQKYSEYFWENKIKHIELDYHINNALWKSENYKEYFDYIFYHFIKDKMYSWIVKYAFMDIMTEVENDDIIKQHQKEWLEHIIINNLLSDNIVVIFNFICELDEYLRRNMIKIFLDNNQDFEMFNKLSLVPNHWSGSGSLVPAYQKQIDFLESLYPLVSGIKFLKHKIKIKSKVEMLHEMIKEEEVEVICRNLYM